MKLLAILNALEVATLDLANEHFVGNYSRRARQRKAFRSRIIRMDAEHMELARVVNRLRIHRMNEDRLLAYDLAKKILRGNK